MIDAVENMHFISCCIEYENIWYTDFSDFLCKYKGKN